ILYKKTQAVEYFQEMIDTPGEFVQHRQLYSALTVTAADASVIAILQSVTEKKQTFSPMFASIFAKPVIGIVTKVDLAESDKDIERAERELRMAGAKHIFYISSVEETGIEELRAYLED
ncbi:EutP/PduV family microcompartment system protein, partial [Listeria monocytogenes]|nr:EutP/PduV family microcompartment system protein [Listeria monocytogenes]